jgi:hypothetical protein
VFASEKRIQFGTPFGTSIQVGEESEVKILSGLHLRHFSENKSYSMQSSSKAPSLHAVVCQSVKVESVLAFRALKTTC